MDAVVTTRGLGKAYGSVQAVAGVDLEVPRHSIFGFLGANGAGKSTTMKLLLGLAKPTRGSGSIFGLDIVRDSVAIRRRVGFLAQEPRFYEHLNSRETLRFVLSVFGHIPAGEHEARVEDALVLVGLHGKADRPVRALSGGERQRLGIAQACIHDPDLVILDEPAASLDPMGRSEVLGILQRLRERATVFYSTHILDDVQRVSDRVAILDRGRLITQAPVEQLLSGDGARYRLLLSGAGADLTREVLRQPWIASLDAAPTTDGVMWSIEVADEAAAERELLRLVLRDPGVRVREFRRGGQELEDVFVRLVGGGEQRDEEPSIAASAPGRSG